MAPLVMGFLMDPLEGVQVGHDTTLAIMVECRRRGHEVRSFGQPDLTARGGDVRARMRTVEVRREPGRHFDVLAESSASLSELDVLFLRKDPPVDVEFLHATQLADLAAARGGLFVLNEPAALRDANEKLFALHFPELVPPTLVSRDLRELGAFLEELGGEMVVKPIDGFGGKGVVHLKRGDSSIASILEIVTRGGQEAVIAQKYLPEGRSGDKRIILLDGEPIGALLRVPSGTDLRGNLAVGGRAEKTTLDARDRDICDRLAPELRRRGLHFVGIDVIGAHLTEVNVTSPTGIEEIDRLDGASLEGRIVDFVERRAGALKAA